MKSKNKKAIALKNIKILLEALWWEIPTIEKIVKLADQKKATKYHGIILLLFAVSAFLVFRFCSKTGREILERTGMPEKEIKLLLNFTKEFDGFETRTMG